MTHSGLVTTRRAVAVAALLTGLFLSAPAFAAAPTLPASDPPALVAAGSYWHGFVEYWTGSLKKQNGITLAVLGVGAVCLFVITRGKWKK